ncbi:flagellar motor switch protein FliG [Oceanotoga sp. DSM 15011]|jgi:flagellar motor switch protein FliG|uniref:Flagellar motor switch protein FliG n=1 Tax=Oceanotoga teriensis TaxID=515440 RepID=A0AA45C5G6_9BACT|nr:MULTISPECIES: flagellar motor switch protein FliG [Oceanotoga]MDN5342307.1 flagellar motor switch protein FliG [Oceanotoga sp.]MDO7977370.1 flagellar motor switch protein FliG [Oceanotoga teriensis]PWJ88760.1 flagellar motor switch protein FliG [Oceanotoga teriensis]UYP00413.1 flagellar motor switch protein FliG [Oceanotoga sp. DSM 15011]
MEKNELNGIKKSAILLVLMGSDRAGKVLKKLNDTDVEQLTLEIANLEKIEEPIKENILAEFFEFAKVKEFINKGGVEYAKQLLENAFGPDKAIEIIEKLVSNLQVKPFDFLRKIDVAQMVNVLQNEHPQTVALVLCYLPPVTSSQVIANLPESLQVDVIKRISVMNSATPDVVKEIESKMKDRLSTFTVQTFSQVGGIEVSAEIMNSIDRVVSKNIFDRLSERDPKLSEEIRKRMFVFEDIVKLDDRAVQRIAREIETKDLTLSLKGASEEVKEKMFSNISKRAGQIIKEELEFMGPVRVKDVDEAQQRIVNIIRKLEESGEIIIGGGGGEELIV